MNFIDMHCDTIYALINKKPCSNKNIAISENETLYKNSLSVDIEKLKASNSLAQFFALFIDITETNSPLKTALNMLDFFHNELQKYSKCIALAKNYEDINKNLSNNKISAFLTIEEGAALEGTLYNLRNFYRLGVRLITLTWNFPNEIGFPNCRKEFMSKGLTPFGLEVVEEMNKLKMIIDVSHLSDGGFYDVVKYSKSPFVASHSNARTITNHPRNLTDDMIKILSNKGGIMGINFEKTFLGQSEEGKISEMIAHIRHIKNVGGIDVLCIGSDFDGIETPSEIKSSNEIEKLISALKKDGFHENEIEKILYKNALRVIKETL
ncbi:membrane dipeptidase [Clostridium botulinum]|uniref:dipeptidase n=1 Tax=Clostridium botulinum TaxID=1491 RepID=UPI001A924122|nr:dipeptidase [Clostridium botulinum]MBO0526397.1 membrane dipeptidase [Clostridium botulinum]MBO0530156.1 membrane dipeptidase [Clostridium botulinum]MBO0534129.1 membrane dipeptidase [Clostridium botulinum]MBO0544104.1 membrane dipeptidase [Clostridium botulinum]MBO0548054.1 membrane dipeptidase [Clostridium botulinum]